jgi:hypothetical protein
VTVPESCSLPHFTVTCEPARIAVLIRTLMPRCEVSSSVAGATRGLPLSSSHKISTRAMSGILNSLLFSLTPFLSAKIEKAQSFGRGIQVAQALLPVRVLLPSSGQGNCAVHKTAQARVPVLPELFDPARQHGSSATDFLGSCRSGKRLVVYSHKLQTTASKLVGKKNSALEGIP